MIQIPDGELIAGDLPAKQMRLVQAWIAIHSEELMVDWQLAVNGDEPFRIAPFAVRLAMDVIAVKPLPEHRLELRYADGSLRLFDMKPLLGMKPWRSLANPARFAQVQVAYGTVLWPGEIDVAPETLWLDSVEVTAAL